MNKVQAQAQNTVESSEGLTHPLGIVSPSDASHASKLCKVQVPSIKREIPDLFLALGI